MYPTTWWYCSRTTLLAPIRWAGVQRQCLQSRRREATTRQQCRFQQLSQFYSVTLIIEIIKETYQEAKLFALLNVPLCSPQQGVGLSFLHTQHKSIEVDYWWKCFYSEDKTAAVLQHKSDPYNKSFWNNTYYFRNMFSNIFTTKRAFDLILCLFHSKMPSLLLNPPWLQHPCNSL